jgi:uncharacterized protein (DUF952 family)
VGIRRGEGRRSRLTRIFKILDRAAWDEALAVGAYRGSPADLADGFIHFSTAAQAAETARRHFHGQADLMVLAVEAESLGEALRWEPSRGGDLFPHLHGSLDTALVVDARPAPLNDAGAPELGELAP